ncbi:MAG: peptidylprolyl isomerase [Terriglobales bacterium]
MPKYCLVCLLLATMSFGQAASTKPEPAQNATPAAKPTAPEVPPTAAVVTIKGLCSGAAPADAACVTTITRAEFEKMIDSVQPNMPARSRRPFADRYAHSLMMAKKAEEMGLDKSPSFEERMKLARIQILAQELGKALQEQATHVSDQDIDAYYKANQSQFEQVDVDRIYVPRNQTPPDSDKEPSEAEEEKFEKESEKVMQAEADKLHARAVAGDDFKKLQEEAFDAAGLKTGVPNTDMGKVRRNVLAQNQAVILELKAGDISPVLSDANGFFIYKIKSKTTMSLDEAREEIKATLRSEHMQNAMQAVQHSATLTLDEDYFGPDMPARGPMFPPPHMTQPPAPAKPPAAGPK